MKYLILFVVLAGCTAPRANLETGRVTPRGKFVVGADMRGNIPTKTVSTLYDSLSEGVDEATAAATGNAPKWTGDEGKEKLAKLVDTLVMFSLDPVGWGFDIRARYGVYDGFDIGLRYDSGVIVGDARFQFMGPLGGGKSALLNRGNRWFGSVGVQYSSQDYKVPLPVLEKLQDLLGYEFVRKDIVVPLAFSYSFGPNEKYGALGFGLVYNLGMIKYGFKEELVSQLFENTLEEEGITVPQDEKNIHAYGTFINLKVGFKWVYAVASLSIYYQDYGKYDIFGIKTTSLAGLTIIPTFGVMGTF
ncbi:MAG: hypothetical protein JXR95_03470 [Deltaproteobacteria bacterium]|nr:hypothetical protein [Deltaproteobacteria bacterium]